MKLLLLGDSHLVALPGVVTCWQHHQAAAQQPLQTSVGGSFLRITSACKWRIRRKRDKSGSSSMAPGHLQRGHLSVNVGPGYDLVTNEVYFLLK